MDHFVEKLEIKNFKSIRDLTLTDFRRINLFIGRPNVGKSNLLEALGMFSLWNINRLISNDSPINLSGVLRIERSHLLFFDGNSTDKIEILTRHNNGEIFYNNCQIEDSFIIILENSLDDINGKPLRDETLKIGLDNDLNVYMRSAPNISNNIFKKYIFKSKSSFYNSSSFFLSVPYGNNLLDVLESHPELRKTISSWFKEYNLRLVLDRTSNSLKIQKEVGENEVFILPYSMIADTLQRLIFYKTAVASNQNSVLIFEEPEAHAYPPYIAEFTQEVIKSDTNQFFIATHSPVVVNDFMENAREDLSIFITDFRDGQTVARALTREELEEVYEYGVDLFFNNEAYVV